METPKYDITDNEKIDKTKRSVTGYSFVSTVSANKEYFTQREIEGADNEQLQQGTIGWSVYQDYNIYLLLNQINNFNPTVDDINTGAAIYGPLVPILQGKTTRSQPQHSA